MSKLTTCAGAKSRWQTADEKFRLQIDMLLVKMRTKSKAVLAAQAGIRPGTMYEYYRKPRLIRMGDLRLLMIQFERYGMSLDASDVVGGACNAAVAD